MDSVSPDQRIHWVQLRVPEHPHPQLKIPRRPARRSHSPSRPIPQPSPPERRFLLNILVRPSQKPLPRPPRQLHHLHRHPRRIELRRPPRDPLHLPKRRKHAPHHKQSVVVQLIAGVQPAHHFPRRARKSLVQRIINSLIRLADPPAQFLFISPDNLRRPVRRPSVHHHILQVRIPLPQDRLHRILDIFRSVAHRRHHRNPRPLPLFLPFRTRFRRSALRHQSSRRRCHGPAPSAFPLRRRSLTAHTSARLPTAHFPRRVRSHFPSPTALWDLGTLAARPHFQANGRSQLYVPLSIRRRTVYTRYRNVK